jgi:hypothetical protein
MDARGQYPWDAAAQAVAAHVRAESAARIAELEAQVKGLAEAGTKFAKAVEKAFDEGWDDEYAHKFFEPIDIPLNHFLASLKQEGAK